MIVGRRSSMKKQCEPTKGTNLQIAEYEMSVLKVINGCGMPVEIRRLVLSDIMNSLKDENRIIISEERKDYARLCSLNAERGNQNGKDSKNGEKENNK